MHESNVTLNGLQLQAGVPRVVAETGVGHCWYPDLLQFSTGELMLNYSLNDDSNDNQANAQAVRISTDGGSTFPFAYDVNGFHNSGGEPRLSLPDGRIIGTSTFLKPDPPDQARRFVAHYWCYDRGGQRYCVEPWGASVEGLPRDVKPRAEQSRTWWSHINWFSDILQLDDKSLITTLSMRFAGDELETTVALRSKDEGRHWHYLSTIAGADAVPDANEGFDEPCLVQLEDGELMCISRVGSSAGQFLARTYSSDGGSTWSPLDRLPAYSVAPQIARLANGVLALSTGRPGLFLWFSADARGQHWQTFDVQQYHNKVLDKKYHIGEMNNTVKDQTTAYTALVEVTPNHLLLVYDRSPFGWSPVPAGSDERSQIFMLEMDVQRV
ncbi:MAG TPA: sialidase family protein [Abditibacteriaceae bacterium]|nr:sialidase family protein [Abditibacteriaceae bacterium]